LYNNILYILFDLQSITKMVATRLRTTPGKRGGKCGGKRGGKCGGQRGGKRVLRRATLVTSGTPPGTPPGSPLGTPPITPVNLIHGTPAQIPVMNIIGTQQPNHDIVHIPFNLPPQTPHGDQFRTPYPTGQPNNNHPPQQQPHSVVEHSNGNVPTKLIFV
jgi:hypothetical protein